MSKKMSLSESLARLTDAARHVRAVVIVLQVVLRHIRAVLIDLERVPSLLAGDTAPPATGAPPTASAAGEEE